MRSGPFGDKDDGMDRWKAWSTKVLRFAGNVDSKFPIAMRAAAKRKGLQEKILIAMLESEEFPITAEQDGQLQSLLIDVCTGKAFSIDDGRQGTRDGIGDVAPP